MGMKESRNWRISLWLLLSTVLLPALGAVSVGILILVFYREAWDLAFGVLVLSFAVFALTGSLITVILVRRSGRLARMHAEFIERMSHNFRTPLTAIRLFVDTLRSGRIDDPEQMDRCLMLLAQETDRMEQLVERVLTWRQLEHGKSLGWSAVDLGVLVNDALAPLRLDVRNDDRLDVVIEPHLPKLMADRVALIEALRNVVENALKYSQGAVVVAAHHQGGKVAVAVRDQGPPISRRDRKRIFRRFYRAADAKQGGTGLGLAIARRVTENMGGRLELDTGKAGNVFTFSLPLSGGKARRRAGELASLQKNGGAEAQKKVASP
jgi:two-component system phosphate regulon sensor histidine kinase PhoR